MNSNAKGILNNQWDVQNSGIALLNRSNLFMIAFIFPLLLSAVAHNCFNIIASTNTHRRICGRNINLGTEGGVFMTPIAEWVLCTLATLAKEVRLSAYDVKLSKFFLFDTHILLQKPFKHNDLS